MSRAAHTQRGVALLLALLLTALATVLAVAVAGSESFAMHRSGNLLRRAQVDGYLSGAEIVAAARLRPLLRNAEQPTPVKIDLPWTFKPAGHATLHDAQGCFNLNSLSPQAGDIALAEQRFRRLLDLLDLPPDIADQLLDWLDEDSEARFAGAEDDAYSRRKPPMRAANAPLADVSELRLLPAADAKAYAALAPVVCALPPDAPLDTCRCTAWELGPSRPPRCPDRAAIAEPPVYLPCASRLVRQSNRLSTAPILAAPGLAAIRRQLDR